MKPFLTLIFALCMSAAIAQPAAGQEPVEQQYHISYGWWVLGVVLAVAIGVIIYMLIKKDPRRDAVR